MKLCSQTQNPAIYEIYKKKNVLNVNMKEAKRDYVGVLTLLVHINVITLVTDDC